MATAMQLMAHLGLNSTGFQKGMNEAVRAAEGGSSQIVDKLGTIGGAAVMGGLTAVAAAVGAVGLASLFAGRDLEAATATIVQGTRASGDALDELVQVARNAGNQVSEGIDEASVAVADLNTRLGLTGPELEEASVKFLQLARVTDADVSTTIREVTRNMGDAGIETHEMALFLDQLLMASQETGIGVDQLNSLMVAYGPVMRLMGLETETQIALLSKWEQEGVNVELVMGSLRIAAAKFADEGVELSDGLWDTIDAIQNMTSESDALALGMEIFGQRAGPDMTAAIREGRFELGELEEMLHMAGGTLEDTALRSLTFGEKLQIVKGRALDALAPIGMAMLDVGGKVLDALIPALDAAATWIDEKVVPALASIMPVVENVIEMFAQLVRHLLEGDMDEAFLDVKDILAEVGLALGIAEKHVFAFLDAFQAVYDFLKGNESAMVAAITAIGVAMAVFILPIIKATIVALAPLIAIMAVVAAAAYVVHKAWSENWLGIQDIVAVVLEWLQERIDDVITWVKDFWEENGEAILATTQAIWQAIQDTIETVVSWIVDFWADNGDEILSKAQEVWDTVQTVIGTVLGWLESTVGTVIGWVTSFWSDNNDDISSKTNETWDAIKDFISTALELVQNTIETVTNFIKGLWDAHGEDLKRLATETWDWIMDKVSRVLDIIKTVIQAITLAIQGDWHGFGVKMREATDKAWELIKEVIAKWLQVFWTIITTAFNEIRDWITSVDWGAVGRAVIEGIANGVRNAGGFLRDAAVGAARAALDAARGFLGIGSPSKLAAKAIGEPFVEGIARGVEQAQDALRRVTMPNLGEVMTQTVPVSQMVYEATQRQEGSLVQPEHKEFHLHVNSSNDREDIIQDFMMLETLA